MTFIIISQHVAKDKVCFTLDNSEKHETMKYQWNNGQKAEG